jgi:homoserine dehydrogenase
VLHEISGLFGKHEISIASLIQHENDDDDSDDPVPLILTTHEVREGDLLAAIDALEKLPCVKGKIVRMRVRD